MDTLLCNDDGDVIFFGAPSATDEVLAFHYGDFDDAYGDGTVGAAAANGRVYGNTVPATLPTKFGTIGTPSTASGQTTYTWTPPPTSLQANVLLVAGGGATREFCGGGGGGGVIYNTAQTLNAASYTIKVGDGGIGERLNAGNGYNTEGFGSTAIGGGGGQSSNTSLTGKSGGSGGGNGPRSGTGGSGTLGQGNDGGGGRPNYTGGNDGGSGGGGGASAPGTNGGYRTGGNGGAGLLVGVVGETYGDSGWFGGGGAGFGDGRTGTSTRGNPGIGGGGIAATGVLNDYSNTSGDPHTGGGAGAGGPGGPGGRDGGSGIVLVRYIVDTAVLTNEETLAFLYTGSGTETETTYTWDAEGVTYADILVVGGGGGSRTPPSNFNPSGGGGGGEVVYRRGVPVSPGVEIKVGRGGPIATQGGISQFTSAIQANGGGASSNGSGGSGGGANRQYGAGGASVKLSVDGMGNPGGGSIVPGAAGGGGATQVGFDAIDSRGANGGEGYAATMFGTYSTVYGSGGGGGARSGERGLGGTNAGDGGYANSQGGIGTPNTGSGAGGPGAAGSRPAGSAGGSGIVLVKPNPGALDGLGPSVYTQAVGAYALRRLFGAYTGAQVRLRRSTDNAEVDVTFDKYGNVEGLDLGVWLEGGTGYVVTWYDQSSHGWDLEQTNVTYQPQYDTNKLVNLNNAYMTIPGTENVTPFSTNQSTQVQRSSMVSFKAPSVLTSNQARNIYAKGLATSTSRSDVRVWWYGDGGGKITTQHGDGIGTNPTPVYNSREIVVFSVVEENSSSSVNASSYLLRQDGTRYTDSVVTTSRTFLTNPNSYPWGIGYGNNGSSRWNADAYVIEHMIFDVTLSDSLRVAIENEMQYYANKNF